MFLLVSGRHVGAHVHGHQHGVSIQISINLGKTFFRISSMRKIAVTWILAGVFAYVPSFYFQILDLIYWTVLIFYFDLFWMAWHWKPATCFLATLLLGFTLRVLVTSYQLPWQRTRSTKVSSKFSFCKLSEKLMRWPSIFYLFVGKFPKLFNFSDCKEKVI